MATSNSNNSLTSALLEKRAEKFALKFANAKDERAEAQTYWNEFFQIFDIDRFRTMRFEQPTKRSLGHGRGFIDLFWKGKLLIEHKSASKNKDKDFDTAFGQAMDYVNNLKETKDKPEYVIICNFAEIRIYNLKTKLNSQFFLANLHHNIAAFRFLQDFTKQLEEEEEKVNVDAAALLGTLYKHIRQDGFDGEDLQLLMIRILFCLFAEDTNIFKRFQFQTLVNDEYKKPNGGDLGAMLEQLFLALNTPKNQRSKSLAADIAAFPYVNGSLFQKPFGKTLKLSQAVHLELFNCCKFDWTPISPAIFGSLFQSVMNDKERHELGAHYTSESNILKLIKPLFLNDLWAEFARAKGDKKKLGVLRKRLSELRFLDPACGCGNFLIITYRELRLLDIEIVKELQGDSKQLTGIAFLTNVHLDNFYGIEYEPFAAYIARVALWLMEHQLNCRLEETFGTYVATIPLKEAADIKTGNALRLDWKTAFEHEVDFIIGNPPFLGQYLQSKEQKEDVTLTFKDLKSAGDLDYVACWYMKSSIYIQNTNVKVGLVSTNSICQGEQVGILWSELLSKYNVKINFAHQTFKWNNEAKGVAAVHCVIVGFATSEDNEKYLFEYADIKEEPSVSKVKNISPYLVEGSNNIITTRSKPICNVSEMFKGSQPTDGGNLLFSDTEKEDFLKIEPNATKFIKPFISAHEYLNGKKRWCLWLVDALPNELRQLPNVMKRINEVKKMRLASTKAATVKWAEKSTLFTENRQPSSDYILIPSHSSENRKYVPFDFLTKDDILNNSCFSVPNATLYEFGILTSKMHMIWMRYTCGRLKSDYRYSNTLVYNNYPFPTSTSEAAKQKVENAARKVLEIRELYAEKGASLADMYSAAMPADLLKAHQDLDKSVDACYGKNDYGNDAKRIAFLFGEYERLIK